MTNTQTEHAMLPVAIARIYLLHADNARQIYIIQEL